MDFERYKAEADKRITLLEYKIDRKEK